MEIDRPEKGSHYWHSGGFGRCSILGHPLLSSGIGLLAKADSHVCMFTHACKSILFLRQFPELDQAVYISHLLAIRLSGVHDVSP